jgi:hypothetical protein
MHQLLAEGYECAAMPFLHFRTSWWKLLANPAYQATLRLVPNRPGVVSAGDATSFQGPVGRCATPDAFPDFVFHVGWVYDQNIIAKHLSHARLYADLPSYQEKARRAQELAGGSASADELAHIDAEYQLLWFRGKHPPVLAHLINLPSYSHQLGLQLWTRKFAGRGPLRPNGAAQ